MSLTQQIARALIAVSTLQHLGEVDRDPPRFGACGSGAIDL